MNEHKTISTMSLRESSDRNDRGHPHNKRTKSGRQIIQWLVITVILLSAYSLHAQDNNVHDQSVILKFIALDGRKVDVSSFKGKVVLVDCWATWCGPCLKELPHIKELYEKYHENGFEVIGISMDEPSAKERVKQIIKQKNIPWPQRFEGKGFQEDSFKKQYDVKSLPSVYLLDKEGTIVDTNARGERLETLLKKYLEL